MSDKLPLNGLKVLDFGDAWSSPFACTVLGDAGADVIKVEDIHRQLSTLRGPVAPTGPLEGYPEGDPGLRPWNRYFLFNNSERNKRGVTLDLTQPEARRLFDELVRWCDVFTTNYTPRAVRSLSLTFEDVRRIQPRVVYAHVTGYGCEGELAEAVALGSTIDAWTGHMAMRGYADTTPYDTALSYVADAAGALNLVVAIMAALRERERSGEAQCVEMAMTESLIPLLARPLIETAIEERAPLPTGNRHPEWAPQGVYPVAGNDRWLSIAVRDDGEWRALCSCLGLDSSAYPTAELRRDQRDLLDAQIAAATRERTGDELMIELQSAGVPAMVVYLDSEIYADPELTGGDFIQAAAHPDTGERLYPGPLWRSRRHPMRLRIPHCGLGEHNQDVLCGLLGVTEAELKELSARQAIGTRYSFWPEWPPQAAGR